MRKLLFEEIERERECVYSDICGFATVSILQIYANIHNIKEEKKGKVEGSRRYVISFSEVVLIQNKLSYFEYKPH